MAHNISQNILESEAGLWQIRGYLVATYEEHTPKGVIVTSFLLNVFYSQLVFIEKVMQVIHIYFSLRRNL